MFLLHSRTDEPNPVMQRLCATHALWRKRNMRGIWDGRFLQQSPAERAASPPSIPCHDITSRASVGGAPAPHHRYPKYRRNFLRIDTGINETIERIGDEPHRRSYNHTVFFPLDFRFDSGGFELGLQLRNGGHKITFIVVCPVAVGLQFFGRSRLLSFQFFGRPGLLDLQLTAFLLAFRQEHSRAHEFGASQQISLGRRSTSPLQNNGMRKNEGSIITQIGSEALGRKQS